MASTWAKRDDGLRRRERGLNGASASQHTPRELDLMDALNRLPSGQREVIHFRYLEDLSVEQTAKLLGCRQGTVKSQAAKALKALADDPKLNG